MNRHNDYEPDRVQCNGKTERGTRCTRIATHSDGGKAYCERHVQIARRDRVNSQPIVKGKKNG